MTVPLWGKASYGNRCDYMPRGRVTMLKFIVIAPLCLIAVICFNRQFEIIPDKSPILSGKHSKSRNHFSSPPESRQTGAPSFRLR
jgi:hypothetical protein